MYRTPLCAARSMISPGNAFWPRVKLDKPSAFCQASSTTSPNVSGCRSRSTAAKAGIIGLTKTVARELAKFNVNCNAVAPGLIETEMMKAAPEEVKQKALAEIVLGRLGMSEEVAWVVTFLCSEKARHITGEVIKVDGGQYI